MESLSVSDWVTSWFRSLGVGVPSLVVSIVAWVPDGVLVLLISSVPDVDAKTSKVLDVSLGTSLPNDALELLVLPVSHDDESIAAECFSVWS